MSTIAEKSVGELVKEKIGRSRIFEKSGIDYCCGGGVSLENACKKAGVDVSQVVQLLDDYDQKDNTASDRDFAKLSLSELIDHICQTHHVYLREELPRIETLLTRVVQVHGETHRDLRDLLQVYTALKNELTAHMMKEEQVLFPMIKQLELADNKSSELPEFHCGSVNNPINAMEHEHDSAGNALRMLRQLTYDYAPPPEACTKYRAMLAGLEELEADLHIHIHKENNILFSRATELEESLA